MENLVLLIEKLREVGLNDSANSVVKAVEGLNSVIGNLDIDVKDAILEKTADSKFDEVVKLAAIPSYINKVSVSLASLISSVKNEVLEEERIEEVEQAEDVEELQDYITSVDGIRVGAKIIHKVFGLGTIKEIVENKDSGIDNKVIHIAFADCEKSFVCSQDILEKFFEIDSAEGNDRLGKKVQRKVEKFKRVGEIDGTKYNLYTRPDFFTFYKPTTLSIFEISFVVDSWVAVIKVFLNYLYEADNKRLIQTVLNKTKLPCSKDKNSFRYAIELGDSGYFVEGRRSAEDIVRNLAIVAENFLDVFNKDVRRGTYIYLRQ